MAKPIIYVTRQIPEEALEKLREHFEVEVNPEDRVLERAELLEKVRGRDGVLCILNDVIDAELMEAAGKQCKIFANYAVGYNNIDVLAATKRGITVTNTPGVLDDATADLAWALLFATSRRIVESDQFLRAGKFKGWSPMLFLGRDISGKTLGVVGTGRIGSNFARKAKGFDMKILYSDVQQNLEFERATGGNFVSLKELLEKSDFVSLHVPLGEGTRHLIGEKELKLMKKTAILINTSRGPVVDEKALVKALQEKEIWGAGLDVFEKEPVLELGLAELDNVVIVPHIASATIETRTNMGYKAVNNLISFFKGEKPENCVNPEVFDREA